jgi:CheY-like chemotaxis protein
MFERFRQADTSTTRKHGGLGIGLAIVRHLVDLHGGSISAQSEGENTGATITIELPLAQVTLAAGEAAPPAPPRRGDKPLHGVRIVVAEDQTDARLAMEALLRHAGAEVTSVSSAAEALGAIQQSPTDVLLSDIGMPDEDGFSLIRKIRAWEADNRDGRRLSAGAVTAYAMPEDRDRALSAGFDGYLVKPIQADELIHFVEKLRNRATATTSKNERADLMPETGGAGGGLV